MYGHCYIESELASKNDVIATKKDVLATRQDIIDFKAEIIKWMFLFWIGQIASVIAIIKFLM
jgi:hypothetical protein